MKEIGIGLGREIDKQTELIEKNNAMAEKTNEKLDNMNMRMRKTLDSVRNFTSDEHLLTLNLDSYL